MRAQDSRPRQDPRPRAQRPESPKASTLSRILYIYMYIYMPYTYTKGFSFKPQINPKASNLNSALPRGSSAAPARGRLARVAEVLEPRCAWARTGIRKPTTRNQLRATYIDNPRKGARSHLPMLGNWLLCLGTEHNKSARQPHAALKACVREKKQA